MGAAKPQQAEKTTGRFWRAIKVPPVSAVFNCQKGMYTPNAMQKKLAKKDRLKKAAIYLSTTGAFVAATYDQHRLSEFSSEVRKNIKSEFGDPLAGINAPVWGEALSVNGYLTDLWDYAWDTTMAIWEGPAGFTMHMALDYFPKALDLKAIIYGTLAGALAGRFLLQPALHKSSSGNSHTLNRNTLFIAGALMASGVALGHYVRPSEEEIQLFKGAIDKPFRFDYFFADMCITAGLFATKGIWNQKEKRRIQFANSHRIYEQRKRVKHSLAKLDQNDRLPWEERVEEPLGVAETTMKPRPKRPGNQPPKAPS